uniref:Ribose transport system substrate-binding protein n=1 Tax=Candidatus Kentrum sp. LPFa TaxID=2126335 RepID=A0A450VSX9_9GAMM|nr:MAG: ribose transport system substrate-binding protein [Candidatus Kentron sp. LPFa]
MQRKYILGIVLFLFITGIIYTSYDLFCGKINDSNSEEGDRRPFIAFVAPTLSNPFFVAMKRGAEESASKASVRLEFQAAVSGVEDSAGQFDLVENLISSGADILCVVPADSKAILPVIEFANQNSVPVINIDNRIQKTRSSTAQIATFIGSDNKLGGFLAGGFIIKKLGGQGQVVRIDGLLGSDAATQRAEGFTEALASAPDIKVVANEVANWSREIAVEKFSAILQREPAIDAVFAANDEMALGVIAAIDEARSADLDTEIFVVGFDATPDGLKEVESGKLSATVAQQPELMGKLCVENALQILGEHTVEAEIPVAVKLITN